MKTNKVPFAYDENGNIYDFKNAVKNKSYYCQCGEIVKIRGGEKISNHFYHIKETECCNESIIHKAYKQVFLNEKKIMLPETYGDKQLLIFDSVVLEKQMNNYKPDAIGYINGDEYLIEFAKTSFVGDQKLEKIRKSNLFCVEVVIDTSLLTIDEIKEHIVNKKNWKDILHIPGDKRFAELKEKLSDEYIEKLQKIHIEYKESYEKEINKLKEKINYLENKIIDLQKKPEKENSLFQKKLDLLNDVIHFKESEIQRLKTVLKDTKLRFKTANGNGLQIYESDDKKIQGFLSNNLITFRNL